MKAVKTGPVRTYTIGFELAGFDETAHSAAASRSLGIDHTERTVTAKEPLYVIPQLPNLYDEPFANSSQIPTHLVSAVTRRHVNIAPSDDGSDEMFGVHNRCQLTIGFWRSFSLLPRPLRRAIAATITAVQPIAGRKCFRSFPPARGPGRSPTSCTSSRRRFAPKATPICTTNSSRIGTCANSAGRRRAKGYPLRSSTRARLSTFARAHAASRSRDLSA